PGQSYAIFERDPRLKSEGTTTGRGAVFPAGRATGTPGEVDVVAKTWATGGRDYYQSNTNHTEEQLAVFLDKQDEAFLRRIVAIELHSHYSPCSGCTGILK